MDAQHAVLVLGGGCFWCTEAIFDRVRGVVDVQSGYSNGHGPQPSYEQVCTGSTGYAEVVRVVYDASQISVRALLEVFFATHDPTSLNRQGNDVGTQYRSAVFCTSPDQAETARSLIAELDAARIFDRPIVTEVAALADYWPAENYHQDYFALHPGQGYCSFVVGPKIGKFRQRFQELLKPHPMDGT